MDIDKAIEITFQYGTMVTVQTETGILELFVEKGTQVSNYDWANGPDKDGMVNVSFPINLGQTRAIFTGKVAESILFVDWDKVDANIEEAK